MTTSQARRARRTSLTAVLASLSLTLGAFGVLGGCADAPEESTLTVTGAVGAPPVVEFDAPLPVEPGSVEVIVQGEGQTVSEGAPIVLATTSYDGKTGEIVDVATAGRPRVLRLSATDLGPELFEALDGAKEGSRLVVLQPVVQSDPNTAQEAAEAEAAAESGEDGAAEEEAAEPKEAPKADAMLLVVVDVLHTHATGEPVEVPEDLGVVVGEDANGAPSLAVVEPFTPTALRVVPLAQGEGAAVIPGQEVTLQFLGVDLSTGEVYDSTWTPERGPQVVAVDETFPGLREALLDQNVGSRILVIAPAAEAFGDAPLALVVDVLAAYGGDDEKVVRAS